MSKKRMFWIILSTVIIIGVLVAGGAALYRAGYMHGVLAAPQIIEGESAWVLPHSFGYRTAYPGRFMSPLPVLGLLCGGGLFLVLIFGIGASLRHLVWRRPYGPWAHKAGWDGPTPPWGPYPGAGDQEAQQEEPEQKTQD